MKNNHTICVLAAMTVFANCGDSGPTLSDGRIISDASQVDGATARDAAHTDAVVAIDALHDDAVVAVDAAPVDAVVAIDAAHVDALLAIDASHIDAAPPIDALHIDAARPIDAAPPVKRIFMTAALVTGDIGTGGLAGADFACNHDSNTPSGGSTYKALLEGNNATTNGVTYFRPDNTTLIATATGGDLAATLTNAIALANPPNDVFAWTGMGGQSCSGSGGVWTDNTGGGVGNASSVGNAASGWQSAGNFSCNSQCNLYCVEQ